MRLGDNGKNLWFCKANGVAMAVTDMAAFQRKRDISFRILSALTSIRQVSAI